MSLIVWYLIIGAPLFIAACETVRWRQLRQRRPRSVGPARYVRKPTVRQIKAARHG